MRLHIEHTTTYRYERPVRFGRHRLVLRPREGHDCRIERMRLHLEPAHELTWVRDLFGNSIALVDWRDPANVLTIVSDVIVERLMPTPGPEREAPWRVPFPPDYDLLELPMAHLYQSPGFPECGAQVRDWMERALVLDPQDAEGTMLALCGLVFHGVAYRRRVDKGVQTPACTLERGTGSCRDMATLMMEAARLVGVPARFVSGYLHCAASMAGYGSTHAWVEIYLPTLGWRGFDPTTGAPASPRHVAIGVSSHPRGVMPVSGAFVGAPGDYKALEVMVRTEQLEGTGMELSSDSSADAGAR
jgi:transglutaminase-like putative cysteine protease